MSAHQEVFRVLVGMASAPRDIFTEQKRISRIQCAVEQTLKPLKLSQRVKYLLDFSTHDHKQWLIVSIEPSQQRNLFEEIELSMGREGDHRHAEAHSAYMLMKRAFQQLRILAHAAMWNPDQFFEFLDSDATSKEMRATVGLSFDDVAAEMQAPDGTVQKALLPKTTQRHTQQAIVQVTFNVKLVGDGESVLLPEKTWRRVHGAKRKEMRLFWIPYEHPTARDRMYEALIRQHALCATVHLTFKRSGEICSLELHSLDA